VSAEVEPVEPTSDSALLNKVVAGDRDAFEALVTRHQDAVFRFARSITSTREDAEDVLQETFLAAYRAAAGYRGEASVRTWLLIIARNTAFRIGRGTPKTTTIEDSELWDLGLRAGWGQNDPESLAMRAQQTAHVLGLTIEGMKSRLHRARLKLAAALRQGSGYGK
jgi:RNA polymerase sigma-70 factor, ECF subfamily